MGNYFICTKSEVPALLKKAKAEAAQIIKEFSEFYTTSGVLEIEVEPVSFFRGYGIAGKLTWDGKVIKEEKDIGLLFLSLNEMMLSRMIEFGFTAH